MNVNKATRISIVDDDRSCRMALSSLVRSLGYEPCLFSCAEAFLASPEIDDSDCLITDLHMPGIDGLQLLATMVSRSRTIPVIVITAYAKEPVRARGLAAGAVCVLAKPYDAEALIDCIQRAVPCVRDA